MAAVVVVKGRDKLEAEEIKSWCKQNAAIAPYCIPTEWKFVNEIPRNAMGKVNKKILVSEMFPRPSSEDK